MASFAFDPSHLPKTCTPPTGKIVGTFNPDIMGGEYDVDWVNVSVSPERVCAHTHVSAPDGSPADVNVDQSCGAGVFNIRVDITRADGNKKSQVPVRVCLA